MVIVDFRELRTIVTSSEAALHQLKTLMSGLFKQPLSIRQHVAAVGRRVTTLCKGEDGVHQQLALYHVYHNFCLPHTSLRQPLPQPVPTKGTGSAKQWQPRTPAMAAGLTDHVWTLREGLLFRVPPWPQPAQV